MATFYSSFFSSGLLGREGESPAPSPSTPRQSQSALPADPFDHDTTPTAPAFGQTTPTSPSSRLPAPNLSSAPSHDDSRPRLRRRRSSLNTSASPLANLKSSNPLRSAANSQRQTILRNRSGSDASVVSMSAASRPTEPTNQPTGITGRLRSGSVGTALKSRRTLRRNAPPPPPPPTAPLPAPPLVMSALSNPSLVLVPPTPSTPTTSRRPFARRAHTDNLLLSSAGVPRPACMSDDAEDTFGAALGSSPAVARRGGDAEWGGKRAMQVDYPSPVDPEGPIFWAGGRDVEMKENTA